jgi:Kef-type K+ transport system membrane component KefB
MPKRWTSIIFAAALIVAAAALFPRSEGTVPVAIAGGAGDDPVTTILIGLTVILGAAKIGGELFERLGQPAVLGELFAGVLIGNAILLNPSWTYFEPLRGTELTEHWAIVVDAFSRIGVLLLLFEVGLETTVAEMRKVGLSSLLVAVVGVIAPFVLGYAVSMVFVREVPPSILALSPSFDINNIHLFIGAILCATSVGITARVLKDLGRIQMPESKIILGAAVIDDILGLIILAVVGGIVLAAETGGGVGTWDILMIVVTAVAFVAGALVAGATVVPKILGAASRFRTKGMMMVSATFFCFLVSLLANLAGLAAIVGAFAAGLVLEDIHFSRFGEKLSLHEMLTPVTTLFVPVFFVMMGVHVRLETFTNLSVLGVAAGLTVAAFIGKQVCGFAVRERGLDRGMVGLGMVPRGEVGLIMASIGRTLGVVDDGLFSAVVIMVIVTTLITPPLLKARVESVERRRAGHPGKAL